MKQYFRRIIDEELSNCWWQAQWRRVVQIGIMFKYQILSKRRGIFLAASYAWSMILVANFLMMTQIICIFVIYERTNNNKPTLIN